MATTGTTAAIGTEEALTAEELALAGGEIITVEATMANEGTGTAAAGTGLQLKGKRASESPFSSATK